MTGSSRFKSVRPLSDGEIISASRSDPASFAVIFDRHYNAIYAYLQRRAGPSLADDLAAETFTIAFRRRARYQADRAYARPWLLGIATNLLRRHRRREIRELRALARKGIDPHPHGGDESNRRVNSIALKSQLAKALASIPSAQRDILLLHAWGELSYKEIADALGIPVGTVRSRLARSRLKLQELLAGERAID